MTEENKWKELVLIDRQIIQLKHKRDRIFDELSDMIYESDKNER